MQINKAQQWEIWLRGSIVFDNTIAPLHQIRLCLALAPQRLIDDMRHWSPEQLEPGSYLEENKVIDERGRE